jgi:hypothetical protein
MGDFLEKLCSPKVGLLIFGPVVVFALIKGCAEMEPPRG